jgi:hypothetical protein
MELLLTSLHIPPAVPKLPVADTTAALEQFLITVPFWMISAIPPAHLLEDVVDIEPVPICISSNVAPDVYPKMPILSVVEEIVGNIL